MTIWPRATERLEHLPPRLRVLVLAHLLLADEAGNRDPDADGSLGELCAELLIEEQRLVDMLLEVLDEACQHPKILIGIEHLRSPVTVCDAEVPGWRGCALRAVPTRRDVSVRTGDDHQHL